MTTVTHMSFTYFKGNSLNGMCSASSDLSARCNWWWQNVMSAKVSSLDSLSHEFLAAVHPTRFECVVYINTPDYKLNFGRNVPTGSTSTFVNQSYKELLLSVLKPPFASDTTPLLSTLPTFTSNISNISPSNSSNAGFGSDILWPVTINSKTYISLNDMQTKLDADGYITFVKSVDKTTYLPGTVTEVRVDYYATMNTVSDVVNAVVLQQDPNQIIINDQTGQVRANYKNLYILSYFFKTGKIPKVVT